ncbi:MAG: nucleoside hydrolase, partial [Chloroflexi bacterium]|nr:nucleoside hydrolase [Chloroflexota bacterium]
LHEITLQTTSFLRQIRQVPGFLLPDPLAMAVTLDSTLVQHSDDYYVTVELQGERTRGQTVVDYYGLHEHAPNVSVVTVIDIDEVCQMFWRMVK